MLLLLFRLKGPLAKGGLVLAMAMALRLAAGCLGRLELAARPAVSPPAREQRPVLPRQAARPTWLLFEQVGSNYLGLSHPADSLHTSIGRAAPPVTGN